MPLNLYSKDSVDNLLADKLDLAGGTMTGGLTLSATGIIFSDATYLTTAPSGSTLAADQLTAGVVTANPTSGPTASGDVLQYDGTNLIWAAGGGGGGLTISTLSNGATSTLNATAPTTGQALTYDGTDLVWATAGGGGGVAWGAITGTLSDQTDLQTALDAKLPTRSVNTQTSSYTLVSTDANNIVFFNTSSGDVIVPQDSTYNFPIGTVIVLCCASNGGTIYVKSEDQFMAVPGINAVGASSFTVATWGAHIVKVGADLWSVF